MTNEPMTQPVVPGELVERLRGLMSRATPGPWEARGCELVGCSTLLATLHWHSGRDAENEADAALIVEAINALPTLLAAIESTDRQGAGEVELRAERDFLLARASKAGSFSWGDKGRWTGASSNSLVALAFGQEASEELPFDGDDLAACYRTIMRLPAHLRSDAVFDQLARGEEFVGRSYATHVEWAKVAASWPGIDALRPAARTDTHAEQSAKRGRGESC